MNFPQIIQGGMGIAISNWRLARAVARRGQIGVVSGTAIDSVHVRILQDGDKEGVLRTAYKKFPVQEIAQRFIDRWFIPGGKKADAPYRLLPVFSEKSDRVVQDATVLACFGEVELARGETHGTTIGINLLDKIRIPQLASLYGAMLAGVDYVLMGAGIPRHVPGILDNFAEGRPASVKFDVEGGVEGECTFDPSEFLGRPAPKLKRPKFLAIITSATLATSLAKKASGKVDGFVVETAVAGGHNAPPRGPLQLTADGEPIYGKRDVPELDKIAAVGLPFWIGGGFATAEKIAEAKATGAAGVQIGTAFACCEESGMAPSLKKKLIALAKSRTARIFTDPFASPTGFPFKVAQVEGTLSEKGVYEARRRICDMGYLRLAYKRPDGSTGFRCASEPVESYTRKGGKPENAEKRMCLCNGLMAAAGFGQIRKRAAASVGKHVENVVDCVNHVVENLENAVEDLGEAVENIETAAESMVSTVGDSLADIARFLKNGADSYSACDVLQELLGPVVETASEVVLEVADAISSSTDVVRVDA
ncbi:MAG: nitronate monooxygenase [Puniceicoccales bacterium]|jgi:NAD(P)H-dependent flavin oxidoreductase YrpB (nitropropane dioxygenase family)|nr:nitronate monooxygenase [Puniceicoccales bacterium]